MIKRSGARLIVAVLVLVLSLSAVGGIASAQSNNLFTLECIANGITVWAGSNAVFHVQLSQISVPLSAAITTGQNQPVKIGAEVSMWALKSNELQVHYNFNSDLTKLVVPANVCGAIPSVITAPVAPVAAPVYPAPYLPVWPHIVKPVYVQPVPVVVPVVGARYHVVQPGENLFRIALAYGLTYPQLAAANGIANPSIIYVGQKLIIP
jgi:LysM repeat protein